MEKKNKHRIKVETITRETDEFCLQTNCKYSAKKQNKYIREINLKIKLLRKTNLVLKIYIRNIICYFSVRFIRKELKSVKKTGRQF